MYCDRATTGAVVAHAQGEAIANGFLKVFGALGYGSSRQVAARRALALYEQLCAGRAEESAIFPNVPVMVTNLHIWLLRTSLRALPTPHAQVHIQRLINHFFLDVEDRIRQVLQPRFQPSLPLLAPIAASPMTHTRPTPFYSTPHPKQRRPEARARARSARHETDEDIPRTMGRAGRRASVRAWSSPGSNIPS